MSDFDFAANGWFLTGPTASGKTAVGLELAELLGAEILSLDSMAIYRGMDIGTAKPSAAERRRVPHHLVDLVEPDAGFSLAAYRAAAEDAVREILARGAVPLFVGGTPLYLKALLRGIFQGPPADWEFRRELERAAAAEPELLHERLKQVDPISAGRLHPRDTRRLIRALEVYEKTGQPISAWQAQFDRARPADECRVFVLQWPRAELYARINTRVGQMYEAGLVDECRRLMASERALGRTARQALGYRETLEHLAGERLLAETIDLVERRTRQFARRQLTWFRSLGECRDVAVDAAQSPRDLAAQICARGAA